MFIVTVGRWSGTNLFQNCRFLCSDAPFEVLFSFVVGIWDADFISPYRSNVAVIIRQSRVLKARTLQHQPQHISPRKRIQEFRYSVSNIFWVHGESIMQNPSKSTKKPPSLDGLNSNVW